MPPAMAAAKPLETSRLGTHCALCAGAQGETEVAPGLADNGCCSLLFTCNRSMPLSIVYAKASATVRALGGKQNDAAHHCFAAVLRNRQQV